MAALMVGHWADELADHLVLQKAVQRDVWKAVRKEIVMVDHLVAQKVDCLAVQKVEHWVL